MVRKLILAGAVLGMTGIILGAFGAHALKKVLDASQLVSFETGVRYQIYHAIFLLVVANIGTLSPKAAARIFYLTIIGVILFSGSIYLLSTQSVIGMPMSRIGFITPIGGTLLIIAWLQLFIDFMREKS